MKSSEKVIVRSQLLAADTCSLRRNQKHWSQDITNSTVLASVQTAINIPNTPVKVFGVPTLNGAIQAYVLFYYTGTLPQ